MAAVHTSEDDRAQPLHSYWLCKHLYLCTTQSGVVFLDIRQNRYFGLCGPQLHALSLMVEGWPQQPHLIDPNKFLLSQNASDIADQYAAEGLLTRDREIGKPATPVSLYLGSALTEIDIDAPRKRPIGLQDIRYFLGTYTATAYSLRMRPFETIVMRQAERKSQASCCKVPFLPDLTAELVGVFRLLRSLLAAGKNQCLFQALALTRFLAHYGQFPTWVIGIRTDPWGAHSWVQEGNLLLDSTPEIVRFYTPILAI
jgi:hypothetical protein